MINTIYHNDEAAFPGRQFTYLHSDPFVVKCACAGINFNSFEIHFVPFLLFCAPCVPCPAQTSGNSFGPLR